MAINFNKRSTPKVNTPVNKPAPKIEKGAGKGLMGKIQETFFNKGWGKYKRRQWRFWPSEASCIARDGSTIGRCLRQSYYNWTYEDVTNPVDEFVMKLAHVGCGVEDYTRKEFDQKGILNEELDPQKTRKFLVPLGKDVTLSGEVDIFAKFETECAGVEMKTYSNKTDTCRQYPKLPHLLQATLYLYFFKPLQDYFLIYYRPSWMTKWATEEVMHRLDLTKIDGETHVVVNGEVNRDITIKGIIKRYASIKKCVSSETLPVREYKASSKDCKQCPYKNKCFKDGEGEVI